MSSTVDPRGQQQQQLPSPAAQPSGRLVATVLSAYDLPHDAQPASVSMAVLGSTVSTGPPAARHRDRNSFKFAGSAPAGGDRDSLLSTGSNELVISAPLSELYPATATFRVSYAAGKPDLVATCRLKKALRVNETQWLILNLSEEGPVSANEDEKSAKDGEASAAAATAGGGALQPTLRLKLLLTGPFRPEINALVSASQSWFRTVDGLADAGGSALSNVATELPKKLPAVKLLLVPAVPLAAVSVALAPVLVGVLVIGLPFFLPLLAVVAAFAATVGAIGGGLYASTRSGREKMSLLVGPAYTTFLSTPAGQRVIYDTGPRPSPKALAQSVLPNDMLGRLLVCLAIDFVGSSSYLLPGVGETFDVAWAPIQTVLIAAMFDETSPNLKYVSFVEEILPFTDFIPSATYGWVRQFGPGIFSSGTRKIQDLTVAVKGEKEALRQTVGGVKMA